MRRIAFLTGFLCVLALSGIAQAHVSLHPNEVPSGAFATLEIRVPNETDNANTVRLAVQLPPGFLDVSTEYLPGWTARVLTGKLAKPVQTSGGAVTEQVREIVWTGHGSQGKVPPGEFLDFPISTEIPGKAGQALTFKVLQTYDNGETVRWIGPPSSEPRRRASTSPPPGGASESGVATTTVSEGPEGASEGLGIAALAAGALGLIAGGAALIRSRRPDQRERRST